MKPQALLLSFVLAIIPLYAQDSTSQSNQDQAALRHKIHSKQVPGGIIPGQIPNLLSHTSGDVHLSTGLIVDRIMPPDAASVLESMTCDTRSDAVVLGKLGKGDSFPTVDQGYIYTDWDLTVEQVFKDQSQTPALPGETIAVTRPGGELTINGRHVYALDDDFPSFHAGDEVLLYLRSLPIRTYALSVPNGFVLSGSKVIPLNKLFAPKFAAVQRDTFLQLVQGAAMAVCPVPPSAGGEQ